ncbi:pilus assembly protein [Aliiroseovarius sp. N1Y82]|nr:pilus assembly protein [Aliiroseovarius subalbicans]
MTLAILEFGNVLWQRQQVQTGVRDAARYWARCKPVVPSFASNCTIDKARNVAFYGNPEGTPPRRIPNWGQASQLTILPTKANLPGAPTETDLVYVRAELDYSGSPLFNLLALGTVTIVYAQYQRYIGW